MPATKKDFMKKITVLIDTREQENKHITDVLDRMKIKYENRKLDYGDYSFIADGRDFSLSCAVERKANIDEIYNNIMHDRGRVEKEFYSACNLSNQFTLFLENVKSWEELKDYKVPDWQMKNYNRKVSEIGVHVYATLQAWHKSNRYRFDVCFVGDKSKTAEKLLENFYYYWHNYKEIVSARK